MSGYKQSYDKSIQDELKKRFCQQLEVLEPEGFRFFSLHQEVIWPFSVILFLPVYVLMASSEYVRVETPLRITSYHLMYVSADGSTFAYVYGLGPKFYTKFMDGTWLVSNTLQSIRDQKVVVQKRDDQAVTTEQVWQKHRTKIQEYQAKGLQPAARVSFQDWVEVESQFDRNNLISVVSLGVVWWAFLFWIIYWIVMNGRTIIDSLF